MYFTGDLYARMYGRMFYILNDSSRHLFWRTEITLAVHENNAGYQKHRAICMGVSLEHLVT